MPNRPGAKSRSETHPGLGCFQASKTFMALEAFSPPATHLTLWGLSQRAISSALGHEARCPGGDIVTGQPELVRGWNVWHDRRAHFREQGERLNPSTVY